VLTRTEAVYPSEERASKRELVVVLVVTVGVGGQVQDAEVEPGGSGGEAFDTAALRAVREWTFSPARRGGQPVAARLRVPFHFSPPPEVPAPPSLEHEVPDAVSDAPAAEVTVRGAAYLPSRGASDYDIRIGDLAKVPRRDAANLLRLAPGVMLTNAGGTGHPYQIFLRGFDAREGQDLEFTVDGIPINEVGNPHGNGLADTHFIIPELVRSLRVVEGPFAPQQGNFAVAGGAAYDVGLRDPGLTAELTAGSFDTQRLLLLYRPEGLSERTFAGAELFSSDGYGENRSSERAAAMGGYEAPLGKSSSFRVLGTSYATHYEQAGVLRVDDVEAGRKGFYDTYDPTQGGDSSRHSVGATLAASTNDTTLTQSAFLVLRDFRLRQNLTGFQQDPQQSWQSPHEQRGDLIDQKSSTLTLGGRGSARRRFELFGRPQELELGYFARYDRVRATQERDRAGTTIPYRTDLALDASLSNLGLYLDASIKPLSFVTLRGGLRADFYHYLVSNQCALTTQTSFGGDPLDTECFSSDRVGYRSPDQTASTAASSFQPRATLLLGSFDGFTLSLSHGRGSRSIDPQYINQDLATPFARVAASELGVSYFRSFGSVEFNARSVFFRTSVDQDLFFNETEGRNTLSGGTTRTGWAGNARATGDFFDMAGNLTLVSATFDDTHLAIPYAPGLVLRLDGVVFGPLPLAVDGTAPVGSVATGLSYVGPRPLPFGESSETTFLVDAAASLRFRSVTVGVIATNLFDRQYRSSEYHYASDFRSQGYPTLVAARHFVAGEPRAIYGTVSLTLGGGETGP
jgi:TonB family protein